MQITFSVDDRIYELLKQGADYFGMDIKDLLEYGANLAALKAHSVILREEARATSVWSVDPITKAVTKVEPHPLSRPEDWDQAVKRALRSVEARALRAFTFQP